MSMTDNGLQRLLDNFKAVLNDEEVPRPKARSKTYAITNFRGGIGKSTLAFNLAYEVSRQKKTLLLDVCPQRNFTQSLLGDTLLEQKVTIYDALLPSVSPGTEAVSLDDLLVSVPPECNAFKLGHPVYTIPGSKELFLFPSLLYTSLKFDGQHRWHRPHAEGQEHHPAVAGAHHRQAGRGKEIRDHADRHQPVLRRGDAPRLGRGRSPHHPRAQSISTRWRP